MITPDDVQFHTPKDPPYDWAETNYFSVYVPEVNLNAWVYTIARPAVGAIYCEISAIDTVSADPLDAVYVDIQQHLPMPDRLERYSLVNGLSLATSNEPYDYHLTYDGHDDSALDWHVHGIMTPYDINDPAMDPLASPDPEASGFGAAYGNHFDMSVHVTGSLRLRGRSFPVDCVTVMDHSWGPRNERLMRPMGWVNANFGEDYSINTIWQRHLDEVDWDGYSFRHGYALIDGRVLGLKSGRIRATRTRTYFPVGYEMHVVDVDDREHVLVGTVVSQHPWSPYSSIVDAQTLVRWHTPDNRIGHGASQELIPLDGRSGQRFRAEGQRAAAGAAS